MSPRTTQSAQPPHPHPGRSAVLASSAATDLGRSLRLLVILFLVAGLMATLTITAWGQQAQYDTIKMHPAFSDANTLRRMELAAKNFAGTGSAEETYAKVYFETYVPGKITQPDALPEIGDLVKNATVLLNRAQRSNNPRARQILGWIFTGMKRVAEGNYHPPARINALLVLGRLDEAPANQASQTPPIPLRYSLPILIAQYNNEANPDGVRAAALEGLHRYVSYGLTRLAAGDKATIQTAMASLLTSDPPPGRSEKAHAYLQRFAVDILDLLRAKNDSSLGVQLVSISTEPKQPDLIALHSVSRLGGMSGEMKGKVADPNAVLQSWSARALHAFEAEVARLNALERPKKATSQPTRPDDFLANKRTATPTIMSEDDMYDSNMMEMDMETGNYGMEEMEMDDMSMMMSGMGMMSGAYGAAVRKANPQPPEVIASRRKLNKVLQQIHLGVTGSPVAGMPRQEGGVLAMVSAQQKPQVQEWVTEMTPIVEAINDEFLEKRETYVEALTEQIELLREIAGDAAETVDPLAGPVAAKAAGAAANVNVPSPAAVQPAPAAVQPAPAAVQPAPAAVQPAPAAVQPARRNPLLLRCNPLLLRRSHRPPSWTALQSRELSGVDYSTKRAISIGAVGQARSKRQRGTRKNRHPWRAPSGRCSGQSLPAQPTVAEIVSAPTSAIGWRSRHPGRMCRLGHRGGTTVRSPWQASPDRPFGIDSRRSR